LGGKKSEKKERESVPDQGKEEKHPKRKEKKNDLPRGKKRGEKKLKNRILHFPKKGSFPCRRKGGSVCSRKEWVPPERKGNLRSRSKEGGSLTREREKRETAPWEKEGPALFQLEGTPKPSIVTNHEQKKRNSIGGQVEQKGD